jgi:Beta-propeller repeat
MKIRFLLTILLWHLIPHPSASGAVFTFASPDLPASIQGEASILKSGDLGDKTDSQTKVGLEKGFGRLPLSFEVNEGQTDAEVKFLSRGKGYTLFLTPNEAVLSLKRGQDTSGMPDMKSVTSLPKSQKFLRNSSRPAAEVQNPAVLRIKLIGASPQPGLVRLEELPGKVNYFIGNDPKKWRTNISTFATVKYKDVYPGIDLVYYGNQGQLEYDFIVAPGADPKIIKFDIQGADKLELNARGDLAFKTDNGEILQYKPMVYQEDGDAKKLLSGHYVLTGKHEIGFQVAGYDASRPLIIDPVLAYSTYIGGSSTEFGRGIAVDLGGNAYVTGVSYSTDFPTTTTGALGTQLNDRGNAFVTKLNPIGSGLVYSTYLGGSDLDQGNGIAVDLAGNAYVTGFTGSTDFPTTAGAFQTTNDGQRAFVAKLNLTGSALVYSTYLGGSDGGEVGGGITVDTSGNAYVTGHTGAIDFPTVNPLQPTLNGGTDAFISKLNPTGSALVYSTYFGGSGSDDAMGIAVDLAGNAYVTGTTSSTDFPTVNAFQTVFGGTLDAFVAKLNATGSALVYSTYLGGGSGGGSSGGSDVALGVAVDLIGNAYVTGYTGSTDFPTVNPLQPIFGGSGDAFVAKINAAGTALIYSTYLGGTSVDPEIGSGIAVDSVGNAYITGTTGSTDFPTVNAFQAGFGGNLDAFVAKLIPSRVVNELVTFIPIESSFNTSPSSSSCPSGFVGEFSFSATLTSNTSSPPVSNLVANVTTLTNGNLLQNADGGPGGVGNTLTIPRAGNFSDGVLSAGEFVDVPFSICLKNQESFNFFVDVHVLE